MILLISKDKENTARQIKILRTLNYKVIPAKSYRETIELYEKNNSIKIVLIDIDSIKNASVFIKNILSLKDIPFIYLTSEIKSYEIERLQSNFCYGCITKNANVSVMDFSIRNALIAFKTIENILDNEKRYKKAELLAGFGHWELDLNKKIMYGSEGAEKIYGVEYGPYQYNEIENMVLPEYRERKREAFRDMIEKGFQYDVEFKIKNKKNGNIVSIHSLAEFDPQSNIVHGSIHDITKRREAEKTIERLAYYDTLTNLPNRKMFINSLFESILNASENNSKFSLLYIDIDNFKNINDDHGHYVGDLFLKRVVKRLKNFLGKNCNLSRLGGDEFIIILEGVSDVKQLSDISNKILSNLKHPFKIEGRENFISASIGISVFPDDGSTVKKLLNNADAAMFQAKNIGKDSYCFFSEELNQSIKRKESIKAELRQAIKNNELELYYQPKIDVSKNKIVGAEALTRWIRGGESYLYPDEFISIAEESGLIFELDKWVLMTACKQIDTWEKSGIKGQKIAVNISALHFKEGRILQTIKEAFKHIPISPKSLEIEITETMFMDDIDEAISILTNLRSIGIEISVDDFGTGYSSLSYLKKLPISKVKIDRSFISDITTDNGNSVLTQAIIKMSELLSLQVVAEGVECKEQVDLLSKYGCHSMQGYYFARPMEISKYETFFKNWKN